MPARQRQDLRLKGTAPTEVEPQPVSLGSMKRIGLRGRRFRRMPTGLISNACERLPRQAVPTKGRWRNAGGSWVKLLISCLALCVLACGQMSMEREVALGHSAFRDLASREKVLTDQAVGAFTEGVARKLSSGRAVRLNPQVTVFDSAELVASALHGGHLCPESDGEPWSPNCIPWSVGIVCEVRRPNCKLTFACLSPGQLGEKGNRG
ncbi:MAG: hypothetical protein JWN34_953 [Bryobacterales bacterium]|jgi:hypothetical protein|nr:hypothetical protein [Bryobacterales bacterium]